MRFRTLLSAVSAAALLGGCGPDDFLPDPTVPNFVDTITLGALRANTDVGMPSAYSLSVSAPVRTDLSASYDFAYDVDSILGPVLLPAQVTGVYYPASTNPGLQRMTVPFDSVHRARSNGYIVDQPFPVDSGDVFLARSLIRSCSNYGVPEYGKLMIYSIDTVANTVTFLITVNNNCGYRGLDPGIPKD